MQYKGIIFDLDGVICSTDEYHYLAWKALADRLGIPFDRERNNLLRGVSRMASLEIILEKSDKTYSDDEKAAFAEEKNTMYRELLGRMSPADLSDDVRNILNVLQEEGLKLAIGSSSKNTGVEAAVAGGFGCAAIGDAKGDERAQYHLTRISDLIACLKIKS